MTFNFREELMKIVQYAELDNVRWKSLMNQVDDKFEEFIKLLKEEFDGGSFETEEQRDYRNGKIDKLAGEKLTSLNKDNNPIGEFLTTKLHENFRN